MGLESAPNYKECQDDKNNNNNKIVERSSSSHRSRTHKSKELRSHQNNQRTNSIDLKTVKGHHKTDEKENLTSSRSDSKDKKRKTSNHPSDCVKNDLTNGTGTKVRDNKRKRESSGSRSQVKRSKITKTEIDSSAISFEDASGNLKVSSKGISKSNSIEVKPKTAFLLTPLLTSIVKLDSLGLEYPAIGDNYKPDLHAKDRFSSTKSQQVIRNGTVYSSVFDFLYQHLENNFEALEYTGGVPYEVLKPVLERVTPLQLLNFEEFNSYIIEDTDILWKEHCITQYPGKQRQEIESWREMFAKCKEQNHRPLPIRKTQLVIDSAVKPPRNVKQQQNGTQNVPITPLGVKQAIAETSQGNRFIHPKKAPIMQKSLMKSKYRR